MELEQGGHHGVTFVFARPRQRHLNQDLGPWNLNQDLGPLNLDQDLGPSNMELATKNLEIL